MFINDNNASIATITGNKERYNTKLITMSKHYDITVLQQFDICTILVQCLTIFMCMRLKNWDKREVHRAFFALLCRITHKLYILRHCIQKSFIMPKGNQKP